MDVAILFILITVIAIGFFLKINTGICAIAASVIFAIITKTPEKLLVSIFPTKLFLQLLGIMLLFAIAQENKTLELFAKKTIALFGKKRYLLPIVIFFLTALLAAIGPGGSTVIAFMTIFVISLTDNIADAFLYGLVVNFGASAGTLSPLATTAIVANEAYLNAGLTPEPMRLLLHSLISKGILMAIAYIVLKGYKTKACVTLSLKDIEPFSFKHYLTLISLPITVIINSVFGYSIGMIAFVASFILILFRACDERNVFRLISWSTLILICGMSTLVALFVEYGGLDLIMSLISPFISKNNVNWLMALLGGFMSLFASTTGTVIPTLTPLIPKLLIISGSTDGLAILSSIINSSHMGGISPISTGGALTISACKMLINDDDDESRKIFIKLFITSIVCILAMALLAGLGLFRI